MAHVYVLHSDVFVIDKNGHRVKLNGDLFLN